MPEPETRIFIGTGSNRGDRLRNLLEAEARLEQAGCTIVRRSHIVQSAPWGVEDQPLFLNRVLEVRTDRSPGELLDTLLGIERAMGRERRRRWGERLIDLDLLFYGDAIIRSDRLRLPHPRLTERKFVLQPLAGIAAEFVHPELGQTVAELAESCPDPLWVAPWDGEVPDKP